MSNFNSYLKEEMGLSITTHEWEGASHLPLYLAKAARYHLCICSGVDFIAAEIERGSSLPELKRISVHISDRTSLPVVLVAQIDARQRKALVSQGIPFVVPGRQAFLPMLGFIANARRALLKKTFKANKFEEIQLGELPNEETIRLQIWTYDPLVAGRGEIDDVSLALTLIDTEDERVIGQLNALFKEELW